MKTFLPEKIKMVTRVFIPRWVHKFIYTVLYNAQMDYKAAYNKIYIYKYTICCVIGPLYWNSWGARAKKHVENLYTGMVESMTDITSLVFKISRASEYKRGPQMVLVVFLVFGSKCLNNEKVDQQSSLSPKIK